MRALIVSLALAVVVVICMAFVVLFAGLNAGLTMLASIGLGIFMVGALFASIAALGPKARPTPLLTPAIAGTCAAALTTVVVIVSSTQFGQAHRAAMRTGEPVKTTTPAPEVAAAPAPEKPPVAPGPEPIQFPDMTIVPAGPLPGIASAIPNAGPPSTEAQEPVAPGPTEQPQPAAPATEPDSAGDSVAPATAAPSAASTIPIPPVPPPPPAWMVLSKDVYDTSKPPAHGGQTDGANPPLPRSRPCGEGGPPCP